jgi:hypothetical protein
MLKSLSLSLSLSLSQRGEMGSDNALPFLFGKLLLTGQQP